MAEVHEHLADRIRILESELKAALEKKGETFHYRLVNGRATFEKAVLDEHRKLKFGLVAYLLESGFSAFATSPVIYFAIVPFLFLDVYLSIYQGICFPVYGVPKVKRSDYVIFDRGSLRYLNLLERVNCIYCSYGNGLIAYASEILARTEQHWCPIKHAQKLRSPHSRYKKFFDYGDARAYRDGIATERDDFVDLRTLTDKKT